MSRPLLSLALLAALFVAGCGEPDGYSQTSTVTPSKLSVGLYSSADRTSIDWGQIAADKRPSELPPLFDQAAREGKVSVEMADLRGNEITGLLASEWQRQNGGAARTSNGFPVLYNGQTFLVRFIPGAILN